MADSINQNIRGMRATSISLVFAIWTQTPMHVQRDRLIRIAIEQKVNTLDLLRSSREEPQVVPQDVNSINGSFKLHSFIEFDTNTDCVFNLHAARAG